MSEIDPSTSDTQDCSQNTYSPRFGPSSPPPVPTVQIFSNMQGQPQDAPESPHSRVSSPSPALSNNAASAMPPSASPTSGTPLSLHGKVTAGTLYTDIESYLMRPEVVSLLASATKDKGPKPNTTVVSQTTTHNKPLLHQESQMRGLYPRFEIEGDQRMGFGGKLTVGDETITSEERWQTKKAAKEGLAEKAVKLVKAMPSLKRKRSEGETQENWIGMLNDYHSPTRSTTGGPIYLEYSHGTAFACTCKIPTYPNSFGSESQPLFPSKKAARSNAAKEAMQFLINQGSASLDGSGRVVTKKAKRDAAVAMVEDTEAAFAKIVNELCPLLSIPYPEYRLISSDPHLQNLYSGGAYFPTSTPPGLLPTLGPIGSVKDINGKKAAKEQCARGLLDFLTEWIKTQDESFKVPEKENSEQDVKVGQGDEKNGG